jgi:hypothetical protein
MRDQLLFCTMCALAYLTYTEIRNHRYILMISINDIYTPYDFMKLRVVSSFSHLRGALTKVNTDLEAE